MAENKEPSTAWEYVDWLYLSGRLTAEEHLKLKHFLVEMDVEKELAFENEGC